MRRLRQWWHRRFPGRWTEAEILWLYVEAHHRWLVIQPLTDPPSEEFLAHDRNTCWKCQAYEAVKSGRLL